jgi:nucleotide-binding universal stress UspA family protein
MSREILVPIDGSEPASDALAFALEHHPDADITAYYVTDIPPFQGDQSFEPVKYESDIYEAQKEHAKQVLKDAEQMAREHDAEIGIDRERGYPRDEIIEYAEDHDIDQIIMGSHGRTGLTRLFVGSVAETVTRQAPVPVTIVRPESTED